MKKCPFCCEEIQDEAIKCRYCGEFLKKKKTGMHCLPGCLIFLALLGLLANISIFRQNLPQIYMPLNPFDAQLMLNDLGEGFRGLWEKLNCGSLQDYKRIYF